MFGGRGNDDIAAGSASTSQGTRDASGSTLYGGPGRNVIRVNGSAQETIVLQQGGTDIVTGFDPQNGDVLDLRQALAESQLNLGGDYGKLGTYVQVTPANGFNATLSFNPKGARLRPRHPARRAERSGAGVHARHPHQRPRAADHVTAGARPLSGRELTGESNNHHHREPRPDQ